MKIKTVRKLHPMTFEDLRLSANRWIVANLKYTSYELPEDFMAALLNIRPTLLADASALSEKLDIVEPDKTVLLNDGEIYTLYIAYDLYGRLLASSWRDQVLRGFREEDENPLPASTIEKLYRFAVVNIDPMLKDTQTYARQEKCLKQLPEIRRMLKRLPVLD